MILIIARVVFSELQLSYYTVWFTLDYLCDAIYIIDMFIRLKTGE